MKVARILLHFNICMVGGITAKVTPNGILHQYMRIYWIIFVINRLRIRMLTD